MNRTNTYLRELPPGLTHIDVYWVLRLFNVTDPCAQHAVKKLLADGSGDKDRATNIREAWETLDRWREMENQVIGHPQTMEALTRQYMREHQAERQEQVRERHNRFDDLPPSGIEWDDVSSKPADRPLASHCPDGGACRHKCGLEPCKEASA